MTFFKIEKLMFSTIRTSKASKEIITELTRKFDLKSENVVARIALTHSMEKDGKLDLSELLDSGGKEFSRRIIFGENENTYLGIICVLYNLERNDSILGKYVKHHIDSGINHLSKLNDMKSIIEIL